MSQCVLQYMWLEHTDPRLVTNTTTTTTTTTTITTTTTTTTTEGKDRKPHIVLRMSECVLLYMWLEHTDPRLVTADERQTAISERENERERKKNV